MELIVPIDADVGDTVGQLGMGKSAVPSGVRVLAIDIHTNDGKVHRLTDINECEITAHAQPPHNFGTHSSFTQIADPTYRTEMKVIADKLTIYDEPKPARKALR